MGELKTFVSEMFSDEFWKSFCRRNFQKFSRYCRDQCLEAKRYFANQNIQKETLQQALGFCLANDTLSFANLKDTYDHFRQKPNMIPQEIPFLSQQGKRVSVKVHQRSVAAYQKLLKKEVVK